MYRPTVNITIGNFKMKYITNLHCSSSWQKVTDTAKLEFPTKFQLNGQTIYAGNNNVFNRGDQVTIQAGYFPNMETIFTGYVSKIKPKLPLEIECEDATWILKQTAVTFSLKSTTLQNMLQTALSAALKNTQSAPIKAALQKITLKCVDCNLGSFRATRVSIGAILEELRKTYSLVCFFRDNVLHVGLAYDGSGNRHTFSFEDDIIGYENLEYVLATDVRIRINAISILPNNKKIEAKAGDPDGQVRTLLKYNVNGSDLQAMANREVDKFKYEGWQGSFKTFLRSPGVEGSTGQAVKHGDFITLKSTKLPERGGTYYCSAADIEGGESGQFQTISLGAKVTVGINSF